MPSLPEDGRPAENGELVRPRQFEALVEGFGRLVAQAVRRVAGKTSGNDLDDIQQDVMLALWKRLPRAQAIEHPAGLTNCTSAGQRCVLIPQPFGTQTITVEFVKTGALVAPSYVPVVVVNGQP